MSVSIRLEFDREDRTYRAGEPVGGRVQIDTDQGGRCRGVYLTCFWRTRGFGTTDQKNQALSLKLHQGRLPGEPPHSMPFEFPAPKDCLTYPGRILQVNHFVQVIVDLGFAGNPTVTEKLKIIPGPLIGPPPNRLWKSLRRTSTAQISGEPTSASRKSGGRLAAGGVVTFIGLFTLPTGLLFIPVGLWLLLPLYGRILAERRLGSIKAHLDSCVGAPGESLEVSLTVSPRDPVKIQGASIQLRAEEICASGEGDNRTLRRQGVYTDSIRIMGPSDLAPGPFTYRAQVPIPDMGAYSFVSDNNRVSWEATVRVDIPTWPDWEKVFPLVVWPGAGRKKEKLEPARVEREPGPVERAEPGEPAPVESREARKPVPTEASPVGESEAPEPPPHSEASGPIEPPPSSDEPTTAELPPSSDEPTTTEPPPLHGEAEETPPTASQDTDLAAILSPDESREELEAEAPEALEDAKVETDSSEAEDLPEIGVPSKVQEPPEPDELPKPSQPRASEEPILDLSDAVQAILAEDTLSGSRDPLIKALRGQAVSFELSVDRVERTFGRFSDSDYRNGRTVTGTIGGTSVAVSVWFPEARNEEVDAYERGSGYPVRGTVEDWDSLRKRPNVRAREERG